MPPRHLRAAANNSTTASACWKRTPRFLNHKAEKAEQGFMFQGFCGVFFGFFLGFCGVLVGCLRVEGWGLRLARAGPQPPPYGTLVGWV